MFLTRLELNPARRGFRHLVSSPNRLHAAVEAAFPRSEDTAGRRLWRLDESPVGAYLFVQSGTEPDLTHLVEQAGWPTRPVWSTRPLAPVLNTLTAGQVWGFRLSANPVRSGRAAGAADTKRMGHVTADQQLQWLLDRAPTWGFAIPEGSVEQPQAMLVARGVERFARAGGRPVTLTRCTYEGRLQVEQPARLRAAISAGMGHAKAYGCGLMTLAR